MDKLIVEEMYTRTLYQCGEKDFQPFSISVAVFAWNYGLQVHFIRAVQAWHQFPTNPKFQTLRKFLRLICEVDPMRINQTELNLRNRAIRECHQRLWLVYRQKYRIKNQKITQKYLDITGLGRYFKTMQKAGLKIQISK